LPEFQRRGFEIVSLPQPRRGPVDRQFVVSFPFGRLRRASDRGFELVEVQLAPRGRAAFRLNFGVIPEVGVATPNGQVTVEDAMVGWWLDEYYGLYSCPRFRTWFSVPHWPFRKVTESDYEALIEHLIELMPEVERALRERKRGPHVRRVGITRKIGT